MTPVDPDTAGRNAELCRAGAEALGASNGPIERNAGPVVCCGTCPSGCEIDAKQAAHVSELPRAAAAGCVVRAGARVERVIVEAGRAVGVRCSTAGGRLRGARPGGRAGRRGDRHARAAAVAGDLQFLRAARARAEDPPGLLGRRSLRAGRARLGGGDAELVRRRVERPRPVPRGHLHAVHLRRALASRVGRRADGEARALRQAGRDRRPPVGSNVGRTRPGRARAAAHHVPARPGGRRGDPLRHRPRRGDPFRGRRHGGLSARRRAGVG